jgi:hypothetical protein
MIFLSVNDPGPAVYAVLFTILFIAFNALISLVVYFIATLIKIIFKSTSKKSWRFFVYPFGLNLITYLYILFELVVLRTHGLLSRAHIYIPLFIVCLIIGIYLSVYKLKRKVDNSR